MKLKLIIFVSCFIFSLASFAANYFGGGYGYQLYKSDTLDKYDVNSSGPLYGGFFGFRQRMLGLEGFYYKAKALGDINHNNTKYELQTRDELYGAAFRIHVNLLTFKLGYAFHNVRQEFQQNGSTVAGSVTMKNLYDVSDAARSAHGVVVGLGIRLPFTKNFAFYSDFTRYELGKLNASMMSVEAGLRIDVADLLPTIVGDGRND